MTTKQVISIASKHAKGKQNFSAKVCLVDAEKLYASGDYQLARERALRSLQHSVGAFHKDYQDAIFA